MKPLILLGIILIATFGAGTFDVLFPDVIPLRPYTSVFQAAHSATVDNFVKTVLPPLSIVLVVAVAIISVVTMTLFPHLSLPILIPLGSRGSHSRANRRAGVGWTDKSGKQPVRPEDQFRILLEIFGRPRVVMIYDKQKSQPDNGHKK